MEPKQRIQEWAAQHEITIDSTFVPWSKSRNAGEKWPSLNWIVRLLKAGHEVVKVDYSAGMAHCPAYKAAVGLKTSIYNMEAISYECAHGKRVGRNHSLFCYAKEPILPDLCDVLYSLSLDADVMQHSGFESWAQDFGYDTDSRKAEAIYKQCLSVGLAMNQFIDLDELREMVQDY